MLLLTGEDLKEAFERAISTLDDVDKALTENELSDLADLLMSVGRIKHNGTYEAIATAIYSFLYELQSFNLALSSVPALRKDLTPKLNEIINRVRQHLITIKKELFVKTPDYRKILESVGEIFFEYHTLGRMRSTYSPPVGQR